jgi:hypothetical protein
MANADGDPEKISQEGLVTNDQTLVCNPNWKQLVFMELNHAFECTRQKSDCC